MRFDTESENVYNPIVNVFKMTHLTIIPRQKMILLPEFVFALYCLMNV